MGATAIMIRRTLARITHRKDGSSRYMLPARLSNCKFMVGPGLVIESRTLSQMEREDWRALT